jgi:hypothetical protein
MSKNILKKLKYSRGGTFFIKRCIGKKESMCLNISETYTHATFNNDGHVEVKFENIKFLPYGHGNADYGRLYTNNLVILKVLIDKMHDELLKKGDLGKRGKKRFHIVNRKNGVEVYSK